MGSGTAKSVVSYLFIENILSSILKISTLGKISADDILKYLLYFSQKTGFDMSCKLSPMETICMKFRILFSGENKKIPSVCHLLN